MLDRDYTGEVKVILSNSSDVPFTVSSGDKIAQIVVQRVDYCNPIKIERLGETGRGSQGFGSTDVCAASANLSDLYPTLLHERRHFGCRHVTMLSSKNRVWSMVRRRVTMSETGEISDGMLKTIKKICKASPENLNVVFERIFENMKKKSYRSR